MIELRYFATRISENIGKTPEGFLVCMNVAIAKVGEMQYRDSEITSDDGDIRVEPVNGVVILENVPEVLFSAETIASYEGKSVTVKHPGDNADVLPENWKELTCGVIQHVRQGEGDDSDKLVADLLITDAKAIELVNAGLREVSCGYSFTVEQTEPGRAIRKTIVGNHVALVSQGRAGSDCAVRDSKPEGKKMGEKTSFKDRLKAVFAKAVDEMPAEEMETEDAPKAYDAADVMAALDAIGKRLDALEGKKAEEAVAADAEEDPAHEAEEMDKMQRIAQLVKALIEGERAEAAAATVMDKCSDEDASRAEVLSPGIAKTGDVKSESLKAAMKTADGAEAISKVSGGKEIDFENNAQVEAIFIAASELLKATRKPLARTVDHSQFGFSGPMTAEKLNEINAARFAAQS